VFSGAAAAQITRQGIPSEAGRRDEKSNFICALLFIELVTRVCDYAICVWMENKRLEHGSFTPLKQFRK